MWKEIKMETQALTPFLCRKGENLHDGANSKDSYGAETELDRLVRELCLRSVVVGSTSVAEDQKHNRKQKP